MKIIVSLILAFLKDIWDYVKLFLMDKQLKKQEQKTSEAVNEANKAYNDFKSEYERYLQERYSEASNMRRDSKPVRGDSGNSEESN